MESKTFLKTVGLRIRAIRKSKGLSQEKLSELADIHFTYVSDIENGKVNTSIANFSAIADALEVPLTELLSIPSGKVDKNIETELAVLLAGFRDLDRKKQGIFLAASKGLLEGIKQS